VLAILPLLFLALCLHATPVKAASDYETVLTQLDQLQSLAGEYASGKDPAPDVIDLTLAYTRIGSYNTSIWQLTAGPRDPEFESFVAQRAPELLALQNLNTVVLPNGQGIDFGHLLASINLVYKGIPIAGSWGGDCVQLAQGYSGQASDAAGYSALMAATFNLADDGSQSKFGDQDLRADLDSVVLGADLKQETRLAELLRGYYTELTDYDRAYRFMALSFGDVAAGNTTALRDVVYSAVVQDTGMQLYLYTEGLWVTQGWQLDESFAPALRGATDLFADYLSAAVNGDRVKAASDKRMVTQAGEALPAALSALGDSEAAAAATAALQQNAEQAADDAADMLGEAASSLQKRFDVKIFELILLILGAVAVFSIIINTALLISRTKR